MTDDESVRPVAEPTTRKLDPTPWVHHERAGDYRSADGPDCAWGCAPTFNPDPEYIQSEAAYTERNN